MVATMKNDSEYYKPLADYLTDDYDRDFDKYLMIKSRIKGDSKIWATQAEIIAASEKFDIDIFVEVDITIRET